MSLNFEPCRRAKRESQALSLGYLGNVVDLWYVQHTNYP
jgi:hypothetical protein